MNKEYHAFKLYHALLNAPEDLCVSLLATYYKRCDDAYEPEGEYSCWFDEENHIIYLRKGVVTVLFLIGAGIDGVYYRSGSADDNFSRSDISIEWFARQLKVQTLLEQ